MNGWMERLHGEYVFFSGLNAISNVATLLLRFIFCHATSAWRRISPLTGRKPRA